MPSGSSTAARAKGSYGSERGMYGGGGLVLRVGVRPDSAAAGEFHVVELLAEAARVLAERRLTREGNGAAGLALRADQSRFVAGGEPTSTAGVTLPFGAGVAVSLMQSSSGWRA